MEDTYVQLINCRFHCLLYDPIEGLMAKMKEVGRRRTKLLDDLRNRRTNWALKGEVEDKKGRNNSLSHEIKEDIEVH